MNSVKRFFRKYLCSSFMLLLGFFTINVVLLLIVLIISWNRSTDPDMSISAIASYIHADESGKIYADKEAAKLLSEKTSWAMLLNDTGGVIWEEAMPGDLPRRYTSADIARFSRWYLEEYPVLVQDTPYGLLVIGCPPNSLVKYSVVTDAEYIRSAIRGIIIVIISNITLLLVLFWNNTLKIEKAVVPILNGIERIAQGKSVMLSEKGELTEITAKVNQAGKQILSKEQARADWINGISHDIRTPLSIMLGYAGEIEDDVTLSNTTRTQAGLIRKNGEKLRCLVTDLNLTSKLEYTMQPLRVETVYPVEIARQTITEYLNNGIDKKYSLELQVSEKANILSLQGDTVLLTRLLDNLIGNAITHNPDGCNILIIVSKQENTCIIRVIDDGIGMREEQITALNKGRFSNQIYTSNTDIPHGLGLRLSTQIVKAHKGNIYFESQQPNGLVINVTLPTM